MNITPIQKLDLVLGIVTQTPDYNSISIVEIVHKAKSEIKASDVELVLNKLIEDKYVKFFDVQTATTSPYTSRNYSITFSGLVFHEQGGYTTENKNKKWKTRKDAVYTIAVAIGTFLAGVYSLIEIFK